MKSLIQNFSKHLKNALIIGKTTPLSSCNKSFQNVLITGMGGSGIGGTIISELANTTKVPIMVNNTYNLPSWVNSNTLVIASTYSGDTEETLCVIEYAIASGAEVALITSGGKAGLLADKHNLNKIVIEGGNPPRSMLSYSLVSQMFLLNHYRITNFDIDSEINSTIDLIEKEEKNIIAKSLNIANSISGTTPIIYGVSGNEGITVRFRQQLNENAKMLCWHHIIPEMNHNELVGWAGAPDNLSIVFLRNSDDDIRNQHRINITKSIISKYTPNIFEIYSKGKSKIIRTLYHIHFEDWVSMHLSMVNNVDAVEIQVIKLLKSELSK